MKLLLSALSMLALLSSAWAGDFLTVYGVLDVGVVADRDSGKSMTTVEGGGQGANRLGFKGQEDLGGGMSAIFDFASFFSPDTGTLKFRDRLWGFQSWVGLAGSFGAIRVGRMFTPYFSAIDANDPFDACGPGESTRVFYDSGVRMDNAVKYSLPATLNGIYGDIAWGAGEVAGNSAAGRQLSANFGFARGPVNLELGYHAVNDALGNNTVRSQMVGGSYDFGRFKLWTALARSRSDTTLDTRDTLLGISIPFGLNTIAADYVHKRDRLHPHADATQRALGYYHHLSVRTNLYLVHSGLSNGSAASYQTTLPGASRRLTAFGIRHQF